MATPIGHTLAGYAVYSFKEVRLGSEERFIFLFVCLFMANAPDLDFLPGILMGRPAVYHQGITHSLGFAILLSVAVALIVRLKFKAVSFNQLFILSFVSYLSHLIIDFFCPDWRPPYGIPILWPISGEHYSAPFNIFLGVRHASYTSASTEEWLSGILNIYNVGAVFLEVLIIMPAILIGRKYRQRTQINR